MGEHENGLILCRKANWRAYYDQGMLWPTIQIPSGKYIFPDCSWHCAACEVCLGCLRGEVFNSQTGLRFTNGVYCPESPTGFHEPYSTVDSCI